ncbi:hypothetical protein ACFLXC_01715 [Chloroflexota bacterium]
MSSNEMIDIRRLINDRENKNVDFKLLLDLSHDRSKNKFAIDVVSFTNAAGG